MDEPHVEGSDAEAEANFEAAQRRHRILQNNVDREFPLQR